MQKLTDRLKPIEKPKPYQHSEERFAEIFERLSDLERLAKSLTITIHKIKYRGVDE